MWVELTIVAGLLVAGLLVRRASRWLTRARVPASLVGGLLGLLLAQCIWLAPLPAGPEKVASRGDQAAPADRFDRAEQGRSDQAEQGRSDQAGQGASESLAVAAGRRWDLATKRLRQWPGVLIAVVFAGMLLGRSSSRSEGPGSGQVTGLSVRRVARQGLMVWIIVLGQSAVGLWVTWLLIQPWYELPNSAGLLIETGFAGGHGTAAAMGNVLRHPLIGLEEGLDLGVLMATAGLMYGLLSGMFWVNLGLARRWVPTGLQGGGNTEARKAGPRQQKVAPGGVAPGGVVQGGIVPGGGGDLESQALAGEASGVLGRPRVPLEEIDPLLLQGVWLALAVVVGVALQGSVNQLAAGADAWSVGPVESVSAVEMASGEGAELATEELSRRELRNRVSWLGIVGSFPLFIYTLVGGAIVRWVLQLFGLAHWIDAATVHRWCGSAMDLLVVAAVMTLDLTAVSALWVPFVCLFVAGAVWSTFCLLFLSRHILPRSEWFPLALINFGMSTGTTATGFVLLRIVDPELRSGAAEDYALAAPLSAPFVGGGMLTIGLPLLLLERVPIAVSAGIATLIVAILIAIGWQRRS